MTGRPDRSAAATESQSVTSGDPPQLAVDSPLPLILDPQRALHESDPSARRQRVFLIALALCLIAWFAGGTTLAIIAQPWGRPGDRANVVGTDADERPAVGALSSAHVWTARIACDVFFGLIAAFAAASWASWGAPDTLRRRRWIATAICYFAGLWWAVLVLGRG